ncbi:MAG: hypothetical protein D6691_10700 [Candidatus Hydrogenedentota bacterium]|jgi:hypothetical protein|nr:MAG: hypothetical protein D6691_10700 [Candidatus Hydrogenedentota bacterium]GIX45498.1 MAG: hypothetical protein KatS3mg130_1906 [Candidatus Sumerlaea sp.]
MTVWLRPPIVPLVLKKGKAKPGGLMTTTRSVTEVMGQILTPSLVHGHVDKPTKSADVGNHKFVEQFCSFPVTM